MRDSQLKAADLHALVDKLSAEEQLRLATYALRIAHQLRKQRTPADEEVSTPLAGRGRHPGLHQGAMTMSADFDDELPDGFWLGTP